MDGLIGWESWIKLPENRQYLIYLELYNKLLDLIEEKQKAGCNYADRQH